MPVSARARPEAWPFFTTKPPGEGTGLGLSPSHDIVASHQGEMTAESVEGESTEFAITLPRRASGAPPPRQK